MIVKPRAHGTVTVVFELSQSESCHFRLSLSTKDRLEHCVMDHIRDLSPVHSYGGSDHGRPDQAPTHQPCICRLSLQSNQMAHRHHSLHPLTELNLVQISRTSTCICLSIFKVNDHVSLGASVWSWISIFTCFPSDPSTHA